MAGCDDCFFGGKQIGYKGDINSPFVIVGESPGALELAKEKPFVGPAGELLEEVLSVHREELEALGIEPFYVNAIGCMPRQKDPKKMANACQRCNPRLIDDIKLAPRKVILALGNAAVWSLTGNYEAKITKIRGTTYKSALAAEGVVATVHPSFLLRGGGNLQQFKRDVAVAVGLLKGERISSEPANGKISAVGKFIPGKYQVLQTKAEVDKLVALLQSGEIEYAAADIETEGFNPYRKDICSKEFTGPGILCIGICVRRGETYVIPHTLMTPALFENDVQFCWHNGKFDIGWLREYGYEWARVDDDTMLMSYLLNEKGGIHDLEQMGSDWLHAPDYKAMLDKYLPSKKHSYAHIPVDVLYEYQAIDAELTLWLREAVKPRIMADPKLKRVYERILIPASEFIHGVERRGFYVDLKKNAENKERVGGIADKWEAEFQRLASEVDEKFADINIRSPQQLTNLLFKTLKLAPEGTSTDMDTLIRLPQSPLIQALRKYREVGTIYSTFIKSVPDKLADDGRVHCTFKLHGTTTGRLSSNKPNMQNVPRDKHIRGQFIAAPGYAILEVDLSQAELRMLACLSRDKVLCDIFNRGISPHNEVAEYLFGKNFDKEQKMIAKNINFGIVYGISAAGLRDQIEIGAAELGSSIHVTLDEARQWIQGWADRFPEAWEFIQKCRMAPARSQTLVSAFGRKRRFGVVSRERLNNLQNEAANFPHQSGAHDITLISGTRLAPEFNLDYDTWVVDEVHDSLVHETPDDMSTIVPVAIKAIETLRAVPAEWGLDAVPFTAEAEIGYAWGNGVEFNPYDYVKDLPNLKGVSHAEIIRR